MLDIGWSELLLIGALALIVVGPKDLPGMLRNVGRMVAKARGMAREFQGAMEDAAREADLKEFTNIKKDMTKWSDTIGGNAPKKFADSIMNPGAKPGETPIAPEAGSHDAADAAENTAWEAEQAAKAAEAAKAAADAERVAAIDLSAQELEGELAKERDPEGGKPAAGV